MGNKISAQEVSKQLDEDKKIIEEFLSNDENRNKAIQLAFQIKSSIEKEWFTLKDLIDVFKIEDNQAHVRIAVLGSFKLIAIDQSKEELLYKIDLDHKEQRRLILEDISFYEERVKKLKEKLSQLD